LAAYETDSVEPLLRVSGRLTFHVDVRAPNASSAMNNQGRSIRVGQKVAAPTTPAAMTAPT
jgi:hypothetical protein